MDVNKTATNNLHSPGCHKERNTEVVLFCLHDSIFTSNCFSAFNMYSFSFSHSFLDYSYLCSFLLGVSSFSSSKISLLYFLSSLLLKVYPCLQSPPLYCAPQLFFIHFFPSIIVFLLTYINHFLLLSSAFFSSLFKP